MSYIVYKHTNRNNGKAYIGWSSQTLKERWDRHVENVRLGSALVFHNAIRKHGVDSWDHVILETHEDEHCARLAEIRLIAEHQTFCFEHPDKGYNMTKGGEGVVGLCGKLSPMWGKPGTMRGKHHTSDAKRKISLAGTLRKVSDKTRAKMSAAQRGRIITDECKRKLSAAFKGKKLTKEHIKKKTIAQTGVPHCCSLCHVAGHHRTTCPLKDIYSP